MLIDKWVFISEDDFHNTGKIVSVITGMHVFLVVDVRSVNGVPPHTRIFEICDVLNETGSAFFDSEAQLDEFITWMDTPQEGKLKVVKMEKKETLK